MGNDLDTGGNLRFLEFLAGAKSAVNRMVNRKNIFLRKMKKK